MSNDDTRSKADRVNNIGRRPRAEIEETANRAYSTHHAGRGADRNGYSPDAEVRAALERATQR